MKKDGGPAFPHRIGADMGDTPGMSLRDYFAAAALQGVMKDRENIKALWDSAQAANMEISDFIASRMFMLADAMLAEREKETK